MNVSQISVKDLSHAAWLKQRQRGIGGSDIGAILGLNPHKTPLQVYYDKVSEEPISIPDNPKMKAGRKQEQIIADWYEEETGNKVVKSNMIHIHKDLPFMLANIDRKILPADKSKGAGVLECKATFNFAFQHWENEVPLSYYAQLQHYLNVLNLTWGVIAVQFNGWDYKYFEFQRDNDFIQTMNEIAARFWNENVLKGVAPEPTTSEEAREMFPKSQTGKIIEADFTVLKSFRELQATKKQIAELEEKKEALEVAIKNYMTESETLMCEGQILCTWKNNKDSARFDSARFKKENPDLYNEYINVTAGARPLILKNIEI